MTPDDLREIERICHAALRLPAEERAAYIRESCGGEQILREVESLLAAETVAAEMFSFSGASDALERVDEDLGTTGPYVIQERLGEGGMGVVYRAHQTSPVSRDVALKIIRPGMASRQLVTRFQIERQALAMMDHPNIARVLDAGATSRGLPYMAMELVAGRSITRLCQENISVRERVELMIPVCHAIQHAHQKGIIHRDIKPSNVLVTVYDGVPVPKVIDFGIAKAIESALPAMDGATRPGVMIGTFDYVSPEQAEAGAVDVDTRTDIYSLGALFYQVLTGSAPIEGLALDQATHTEILRRIREEIPTPASSRAPNLAGPELDWILAKALEKDRDRRYSSADGMAQDLRRYLDGKAVEARPVSAWYRTRKFAARHRYWLSAAAVFVAVLVAAFLWMFVALRQQQRANANSRALRDVVRKIIVERPAQLAQIPNRTALRGELMRDAEGALEVLSKDVGKDPAAELELANAYLAIGMAKGPYSSQGSEGDPAGADGYIQKAAALYAKLAASKPDDVEIRRGQMAALSTGLSLQYRLNRMDEGQRVARQIENEISRMSPVVREKIQARWYESMAQVELGAILFQNGRQSEALAVHRKAEQTFRDAFLPSAAEDPDKADFWARVQREVAISSWMYAGMGPEAQTAARRSVDVLNGCETPNCRMRRAQTQGTLGEIEWAAGDQERGIQALRESVAAFEALAAEDPANAVYWQAGAQVRDYLALLLAKRGDGREAMALVEKNLHVPAGADAKLFKGRERTMVHQITMGAALLGAKRFSEAEKELRDTLASNRDWNPNNDLLWSVRHLLSQALMAQGKFAESVEVSQEAQKSIDPANGVVSIRVRQALAAWDYAFAVAHWEGSTAEQRERALRELDEKMAGLDSRYGALVGALLEAPPSAAEIAQVRKRLAP